MANPNISQPPRTATPPPHTEKGRPMTVAEDASPPSSTPTAASQTAADDDAAAAALEKTPTMSRDPTTGKYVFTPTRAFMLAYFALCVNTLAVAFDATTLSVALPQMSQELRGTALEAFWSGTSFLLASCVLQPSIAAMSQIFGRKPAIYASSVFFFAGSVIAAVANSFAVILVGRTIQGIGGGGLIAMTEVVITDVVPLAQRGVWFSGLSAAWAIGTVTGPLIGAGFAEKATWRWIFWINVPIIVLGVVMVFFFLHQIKVPGGTVEKLKSFDWVGSAVFTTGSTILLFGISVGGVMYEWASYQTLLPLLFGFVLIVGFAFWELKKAPNPMMPPGIFNNRTMIASYVLAVIHGMILWSLLYFLTLYYQGVKLKRPIEAAVAMLPETLTVAPAGLVVGVVAGMTGRYRESVWVGWGLTTLGMGILYLLDPDTTTGQWIGLNIPVGIGTGMLFPATALSIQAACDPRLNAQAAAFFSFLRVFGQSIGVATSGVIFQNAFRSELERSGVPQLAAVADEYSRDATQVVMVIQQMDARGDPATRTLMVAYNEALRITWIALVAFAGFSLLLSFTVKQYTLDQQHVSQQAFVEADQREKRKSTPPDVESGTSTA